MKYKIRGQEQRRLPYPIPEALPERGELDWEVVDNDWGSCKFTDGKGGTLSVPLNDEPCEDCGENHAAATRLHELAHAALSPDPGKMRTSFVRKGEKFSVSMESLILAEELRANYQAIQVSDRRRKAYNYSCDADLKDLQEMLNDGDLRDFLVSVAGRARPGHDIHTISNQLRAETQNLVANEGSSEKIRKNKARMWALNNMWSDLRAVTNWASSHYRKNIHSWNRQLQVGYAFDQLLDIYEKAGKELKLELKPPPPGSQDSDKSETAKPDGDLKKIEKKWGKQGTPEERFVKNLGTTTSFNELTKLSGKTTATEYSTDPRGSVQWGVVEYQKPPLTRNLPVYKAGWKTRATDEGTIPQYMHRWAVDKAIFRARRKAERGTVLIDVSGSMSLSTEQVQEIMEAAPASTIAMYSGSGNSGILRIIAEKGKYLDFISHAKTLRPDTQIAPEVAYHVGMYGGNQIDKPALEWLAKQDLPRIWVSDGQVVSVSHGMSKKAWDDCKQVMTKNRINIVPNADVAAEALQGKVQLWR